ncbi:MAG: alpha/beta hydrolase [Rhodospirillum sp.]|nr:alpha/beta hydrolase [Rhodospirillum sp.]MCF8490408.1 alpha/beta hydrolase [Rhodospirillum sp.]MCF8500319.1 alpha/beta hydrolase [Rhodospirillum sp.]
MTVRKIESGVSILRPEGFRAMAHVLWLRDPDAPPAICVHGLTRNGRDFDLLAESLSRHRRVYCPDVVGRGRSDRLADPMGYNNPAYAADMVPLIARTGADKVDWVGTSMGGLIGLILAALPNSPIRRLVLNDVGPFIPKAAMARIRDYVGYDPTFKDRNALEAHLRKVHATFGSLTDAQWAAMAEHGHWKTDEGCYKLACDPAIAAFIKLGEAADVAIWQLWDAVTCPVMVVHGVESDLLLPETLEEMKGRGPGCEVLDVPRVGHAPALMDPAQIDPVVAFLTA